MSTSDDAQPSCPDCEAELHEIRLIDKFNVGTHRTDFHYAGIESKRSFWTGQFPVEGAVVAFLCSHCGRILLYGRPLEAE
jgi:hypothetical protein